MLSGGLFWVLHSPSVAPEKELNTEAAADPDMGTTNLRQTAFVLPEAQIYGTQLSLVADRPLFTETRRTPKTEPPEDPEHISQENGYIEEPPVSPELPAFIFKGFVRNGDEIRGLLGLAESPVEQWVSKGDVLFEWQVKNVSPVSVELVRDGFDHIVEISQ
jgi:hypothetical protein